MVNKWVSTPLLHPKPTFDPLSDRFRDIDKNPCKSQFKGVEIVLLGTSQTFRSLHFHQQLLQGVFQEEGFSKHAGGGSTFRVEIPVKFAGEHRTSPNTDLHKGFLALPQKQQVQPLISEVAKTKR